MYTCGIIVESLQETGVLQDLQACFEKERLQEVPDEPELLWHVRQYAIPRDQLRSLLPRLAEAIKPGWYIHLFNIADNVLYVVLRGRFFKLPTRRDESWEPMITYGQNVGLARKWTENVPLRV